MSGTSYWGMYPGHNCTNYAAYRLVKNGIDASYLRGQGNAYQWGSVARSHSIAVDGTPRVGDIAWWDSNSGGSGSTGHVAYVEQVGAGFIVTSEDNFGGYFHWVKLTPGGYYPTGFIHFGGTPPAVSSNSGPLLGHWNRWNNGDHSAITGTAPSGATFEGTFGDLLSVPSAGTTPLYSCNAGTDEFTSPASNCEGQRINSLLGYIYTSPPAGVVTHGIWRCTAGDHFDSVTPNCEGQHVEALLGYIIALD